MSRAIFPKLELCMGFGHYIPETTVAPLLKGAISSTKIILTQIYNQLTIFSNFT